MASEKPKHKSSPVVSLAPKPEPIEFSQVKLGQDYVYDLYDGKLQWNEDHEYFNVLKAAKTVEEYKAALQDLGTAYAMVEAKGQTQKELAKVLRELLDK